MTSTFTFVIITVLVILHLFFHLVSPCLMVGLTIDDNPSISMNSLPTNHTAIRTRQENNHTRHLGWLSRSTHRARKVVLLLLAHRSRNQRRPNGTWRDSIDADLLGNELVRETAGEGDNGSLGGSVVEEIGSANVGVDGSVVDYYAATGILEEVRHCGFGEVEVGRHWSEG